MADRFQRYVDGLSDEDALALHRIVSRRAAAIYEPIYRDKRLANWNLTRGSQVAFQKALREIRA